MVAQPRGGCHRIQWGSSDGTRRVRSAIGLYFFSDWLPRRIEAAVGRVLEHRSLIFFAILLVSALVGFWLIRWLFGS
jgi:hypothetical protein